MDEPQWLSPRDLRAWRDLLAAAAILDRLVEQQLKDEAGLSHPQWEVLTRLSTAPDGELRMTELAGAALTSKSGLTYQVAQLEKAGLVRRRACDSDVRGVVASLTEAGWAKVRDTAPGHAALVGEHFVAGVDPALFDGLADGLAALVAHLRAATG
jgi:DNA-binding MarR family transcriptional regulator